MPQFLIDNFYVLIVSYLIVSLIISAVAKERGWSQGQVFLICLLTSPLIGAILFSPYKITTPAKEEIVQQ
jgi:hypothetical protein